MNLTKKRSLNKNQKRITQKPNLETRPGFYEYYMNNPQISMRISEDLEQFIKNYAYKGGISYKELFGKMISDFKKDYESDPNYPMKEKEMLKKEKPGKGFFKTKQYKKEKNKLITTEVNFRLKMFFDDYAWYERLSGKDAMENIINSFIEKNQTDLISTRAEMFEKTFGFKVDLKLRPCGIIDCKEWKCDNSCEFKHMNGKDFWNAPYLPQSDCNHEENEEIIDKSFPFTKEEKSILKLKQQGMSFNKIADKFGVSKTTIEDRYYKIKRLANLSEEDELFQSIYINLGREHIGIYYLLRKAGIIDNNSLLNMAHDDLLNIPGIGQVKASLIVKVQKAIK